MEKDHNSLEVSRFYSPRPVMRDTFIPTARYIDNAFFEDYKKAKNLLVMDKEEIIRNILEKFPYAGDRKKYEAARGILTTLNFQAVYDLCTVPESYQIAVLREELETEEKLLLEEFMDILQETAEKFNLMKFLNWLKQIVNRESPILVAYLGEQEEDYSYVADNVICQFDSNICEGIRIIYQNRLYDYSIYESRRKNECIY